VFVLTLFLGFHPYSWGMIAPVRPGGAARICGPIQPAASPRLCLAVGGSLEVFGVSQMRRTSIALHRPNFTAINQAAAKCRLCL
jgi:hypothetical protein